METFAAFARDNLLTGAIALAIIMTVAYAVFSAIKQREKSRRAAAWRTTRAEQDRIWNERLDRNESASSGQPAAGLGKTE